MDQRPPRWPGHRRAPAGAPASRSAGSRESGQVLPLVAVMIVLILMFAGAVIDIGNAYRVHQQLQASADAAAAAGADNLPDTAAAVKAAQDYSSSGQGLNPVNGSGDVTTAATTDCSTSAKFCNPANTVHVTESTDVPTNFLGLIGIGSIRETVSAQACSPCGANPLDVMIVLDRTGSMSGSKIDSAKKGVLAFMSTMDPTVDNVGLAVLPPAASTTAACDSVASSPYASSSAAYLLVPLGNDYATSTGMLNGSSQLISTINCVQAGGATAYAQALDAARAELDADGRVGVQKVIIILSDGAANSGPSYLPATSPYRTQPCQSAVDSATASKAENVLMYSIAYDIGGAGSDPCYAASGAIVNGKTVKGSSTPEQPSIEAVAALQQIASPGNYYAQPDPVSLTNIFLAISADISRGTSRING